MTSRSCTYFRSVSTSSLMMLARAPPGSIVVAAMELSEVSDSVEARADAIVGEEGAEERKRSYGNCCTRLITLLTTLTKRSISQGRAC